MLKKTACLLICVCLLLCLTVPVLALDGGAAFTDQGSIRNVGAVQMLVDLGLISGYTDAETLSRYVDLLLDNVDEKKEKNEYLKEILQGAK